MTDPRTLFDQCVDQHADGLYRYAFRMLGCDSSARDLVQETFVETWQAIHKLEQVDNHRAWMFTVLRRKLFRHWNRQPDQPWPTSDNGQLLDIGTDYPAADWIDGQDWVQYQLMRLPPELREPLLLVIMENHSHQETATLLQLPLGTVLSRVHRARQQLRSWLEDEVPERHKGK